MTSIEKFETASGALAARFVMRAAEEALEFARLARLLSAATPDAGIRRALETRAHELVGAASIFGYPVIAETASRIRTASANGAPGNALATGCRVLIAELNDAASG